MPLVSVNIPCYNSAPYIKETIESVLRQTYKDFELIIVDDGSSDGTKDIVSSFDDKRIKYIYQPNAGLANARNRALKASSGKYVAFLDHDDVWAPEKLEKQVNILESDPDAAFVYTNYRIIYPSGKRKDALNGPQPQGDAFNGFLKKYPIGILTVMARKESIDNLGGFFDEAVTICEDYDFFIRLAYRAKVRYLPQALASYRVHSNMQSIKYGDRFGQELIYIVGKLEKMYPGLRNIYPEGMHRVDMMIRQMRAKMLLLAGDPQTTRRLIAGDKFMDRKAFLLYCASLIPQKVFKKLNGMKSRLMGRAV